MIVSNLHLDTVVIVDEDGDDEDYCIKDYPEMTGVIESTPEGSTIKISIPLKPATHGT
jgi:hypothetical protein